MNAANLNAKEQAKMFEDAVKAYDAALRDCNAEEAEKAAELFERVGATVRATRARNFAAALEKDEQG